MSSVEESHADLLTENEVLSSQQSPEDGTTSWRPNSTSNTTRRQSSLIISSSSSPSVDSLEKGLVPTVKKSFTSRRQKRKLPKKQRQSIRRYWMLQYRRFQSLPPLASSGILLLLILCIFLLGNTALWTFRHAQCYSREAGVVWREGPSHSRLHRTCPPLDYPTLENPASDHDLQVGAKHDNAESSPRICITTLTDEQSPSWWQRNLRCRDFDQVGRLTWPNRQHYAEKHGYTLVDASSLIDPQRPPAWSKIRAVQSLMKSNQCDWIFWMDADTVITNSSIRLESILPQDPEIDFLVTMDRRFTANSGAWLMRAQSTFCQQFLQDWWDMKTWVREPGLSLSGDNAAFGHLMDQHLPGSKNIQMVPRCTFNSFGVYLQEERAKELEQHPEWMIQEEWYNSPNFFYHGDFVGHASGIDQKEAGIRMLLDHAT